MASGIEMVLKMAGIDASQLMQMAVAFSATMTDIQQRLVAISSRLDAIETLLAERTENGSTDRTT